MVSLTSTTMTAVPLLLACLVATSLAQRSPYAGASDPGVLPQYLPKDEANRLGSSSSDSATNGTPPPPLHAGTLESEALYNRVQSWPDDKKPYWFLNSQALEAQRQRQQQQQQQQQLIAQAQNRQSPFAAASRRKSN